MQFVCQNETELNSTYPARTAVARVYIDSFKAWKQVHRLSDVPNYEGEPDQDEEPQDGPMPMTRSGSQANEGHCLRG
jgi:hypothetical protein